MANDGLFTVNEFARFSRTTRDTIMHYDKIDLLTPVARGENNYRYYSSGQLAVVNVIRTLQELGMSLEEIKNLKDHRTPDFAYSVFDQQIKKIDQKIDGWVKARNLLYTLNKIIESAANVDENEITVKFIPAEAIVLGGLNDYSRGRNDYDAIINFYQDISHKYPDLDLNYPVWGLFSEERIKRFDFVWPDRYYFYNPEGREKKPASLYAIGYSRGDYGKNTAVYPRIIEFIERNNYEISGDAYEEYLLNEVCMHDNSNYLARVMIAVKEKE